MVEQEWDSQNKETGIYYTRNLDKVIDFSTVDDFIRDAIEGDIDE